MRVLMYAKMLKETENEETRHFYQIFVIGGILIAGARPPRPPPGYAYDFKIRSRLHFFLKKNI